MLKKLKSNRNPHYQFYDDYNTYQERCKTTDSLTYNTIFSDDLIELLDPIDAIHSDKLKDELDTELKDNEEKESEEEKDEIELKT